MKIDGKDYRTVWMEDGIVKLINQPLLPHKFEIYDCKDYKITAEAIRDMVVRGAGAIGATAGYAMAQAFLAGEDVGKAAEYIKSMRPTAQNLFYAVDKVLKAKDKEEAVKVAQEIADEDADFCERIGEHGENLIQDGFKILTHCNAGWLAFVDWGSALSPVYKAKRNGKNVFVFADETRPRCQGARLTAFELAQEGVPHAVIADNAAGYYMKKKEVDFVIVGSDRIAANGDVANKIGTYEKAVLAKENGIPFYVAAPTTTIDFECESGDKIPIEERDEGEVLCMFGKDNCGKVSKIRIAPEESKAKNPAFDVTPAKYIAGIITEKGIFKPEEIKDIKNS
ncbi:S-methyl-5-thioribose-1-phosphate isomerase [Candidatus Woesearchaeota archaeon]|nr:S-methyl-5-thioribose-1-phosphate isomerase [Candidatus Woesearchaeota archaeon]